MKQSTLCLLFLFSLLITLSTSCVETESNKHDTKLRDKSTTTRQLGAPGNIKATLTITSYERGGDSGGPAECDGLYHSNEMYLVSLPTRWYNHGKHCYKFININYNGTYVQPMVVDECDSPDNILVASKAVWELLQVPKREWGDVKVTWSFA